MYPKVIEVVRVNEGLIELTTEESGEWHFAVTDTISFGPWSNWWEAHKMLSLFIFAEMDGHTLKYVNLKKALRCSYLNKA